jgi:hypothetical protein
VHGIEDPAAAVGQRLEDLLERGGINDVVPPAKSDHREHLTGGRDGPLDQLSARLLEGAEQRRRERQRGACAEGGSEELATIDH